MYKIHYKTFSSVGIWKVNIVSEYREYIINTYNMTTISAITDMTRKDLQNMWPFINDKKFSDFINGINILFQTRAVSAPASSATTIFTREHVRNNDQHF